MAKRNQNLVIHIKNFMPTRIVRGMEDIRAGRLIKPSPFVIASGEDAREALHVYGSNGATCSAYLSYRVGEHLLEIDAYMGYQKKRASAWTGCNYFDVWSDWTYGHNNGDWMNVFVEIKPK